MTLEATPRASIIAYLKTVPKLYYRAIAGNHFQSGIPDILVCYRGLWIALEIKGPDGSLRPGQKINIRQIRKAGGIGEPVRTVAKVKLILETVREGRTWENTDIN